MPYSLQLLTLALAASLASAAQTAPRPGDPKTIYVGKYSLDIGGGDAMSSVHLLVFPTGDYAIVYFGGMQQGTWRTLPNGQLELLEWPADPADFLVYGTHDPALGSKVRVQFNNFEDSAAKIGLVAAPGAGPLPMHPAFGPRANGFDHSYSITRPAAALPVLYLAAYQDDSFKPEDRLEVTKQVLYSFPLDKRYNRYLVVCNTSASIPSIRVVGGFVNGELRMQTATTDPHGLPPSNYRERDDLDAKEYAELKPYLQDARALPADTISLGQEAGEPTRYYRLNGTSKPFKNSDVHLLEPLFKTSHD